MSIHDFYVLSPYLAMAGAAFLVILFDLALPKKTLLPYLAFVALAGPLVMSVIQVYDLGGATNLLDGAEAFSTEEPSILLGALSVDRFALFFNFLIITNKNIPKSSFLHMFSLRDLIRFCGFFCSILSFSSAFWSFSTKISPNIQFYICFP